MKVAPITPKNIQLLTSNTKNIYESIAIISKRAKQVLIQRKRTLQEKLNDFNTTLDNLEEVFEDKDQIAISKQYEKMAKPTTIAIEEFLYDKVMYHYPDKNEIEA